MSNDELKEAIEVAYKMALECAPQNSMNYAYSSEKPKESPLHKPTLDHFVRLLEIQAKLAGYVNEQN